ncbi:hypothetical protein acdb102_05270 [Acidothermaceae bacterium B102]|nr:hypothetical protein acdb102_05270 [Acidothermaceae bacterium B102]
MSIPAQVEPLEQDDAEYELWCAVLDERQAYAAMRFLVPELSLPESARGPLTAAQEAAIEQYQEVRDRLDTLRATELTGALG